jgi:hypothetical protein
VIITDSGIKPEIVKGGLETLCGIHFDRTLKGVPVYSAPSESAASEELEQFEQA